MTNFEKFTQLHNQQTLFILGNVHDAHSAQIFEKLGYQAIGTSSAAIASSFGVEDGENISFKQLLTVVKNITKSSELPLTVDLETGYGDDVNTICDNIKQLANLGVVGVNIEDSVIKNNERKIQDEVFFSNVVSNIRKYIDKNNLQIFLNIRTDYYIMGLNEALKNTLSRIKSYENAGADGIFIPCITSENDIKQAVKATKLPTNVMTIPNLVDYKTLVNIGVKRISTGPFSYNKMMGEFENTAKKIITSNSFNNLF